MTRPEYLTLVASWPEPVRLAFGERANQLTPEGMVGWQSAERRAFEETAARLAAGAFSQPTPQPHPLSSRPGRQAPVPGLAGLGFACSRKGKGA